MEPTERLSAALADRYAIESEIDSGGMATVYRARDLKHDRTVAIKVLRPDLAEAIGADRFLREVRTTANLSHPHILPLFDSGEAEGFLYYVMPFIRGESLRDRLEREGPLPIEDAVQIAREVAGALAYAHREGVIHRDIKPANILLEEGHALLTDFGIAQARAGAEETKLTGSGMSLGTPAYMSPEQISGNQALDGRADQYALGCVLYEMLAGHPPFTGSDIQTVMRQHLAADAPTVTQTRPTVPKGVAKAANRALAKTPADRFRTLSELEKALAGATLPLLARIPMGRARGVLGAAVVTLVAGAAVLFVVPRLKEGFSPVESAPDLVANRVVVLPFETRINDPELASLGELAASQVAEAIQRLELVVPVPFNLAREYSVEAARDGSTDPTRTVAERTNAALAVTGTVFGIGDSVQFQLDIIDVADGVSLQPVAGAGSRERPMEAITTLGQRVGGALFFELDPSMEYGRQSFPIPPLLETARLTKRAYEADDRGNLEEALELHRQAYGADTTFVFAIVNAGQVARRLGDLALQDSLDRFAEERQNLLPESQRLSIRANRARRERDWEELLLATRENHRLDPLGWPPIAHSGAALNVNRPEEALAALEEWDPYREEMGPIRRYYWIQRCQAYHVFGDHERELMEAQEGRSVFPDRIDVLLLEIQARAALGQVEDVMGLLDEARSLDGDASEAFVTAGEELRAHGHPEAARAASERGIEWLRRLPAEEAQQRSRQLDLVEMLYNAQRWEEAHALHRSLAEGWPGSEIEGWLGRTAARAGDTATARATLDRLFDGDGRAPEWDAYVYASLIAAILGERDEAMELLREAFSHGFRYQPWLHRQMDLESLRDREDWQELMRPKG